MSGTRTEVECFNYLKKEIELRARTATHESIKLLSPKYTNICTTWLLELGSAIAENRALTGITKNKSERGLSIRQCIENWLIKGFDKQIEKAAYRIFLFESLIFEASKKGLPLCPKDHLIIIVQEAQQALEKLAKDPEFSYVKMVEMFQSDEAPVVTEVKKSTRPPKKRVKLSMSIFDQLTSEQPPVDKTEIEEAHVAYGLAL